MALGQDCGNLADSLSKSGSNHEAILAAGEGLAILKQLVALDPKNTEFRGIQAALYTSAGDAYARSADSARALENFREASSILSQVQSEDPANVDVRLRVAGISNKVASMLTRINDLAAATAMYWKALELVRPEAAAHHPNEQALYSTADSYAGLGETEIILATDNRQTRQNQIKHWDQARSWNEQSMNTWRQVKEPGMISPDGLDCVPPATVARQLARCKAALARLTARSSARRQ